MIAVGGTAMTLLGLKDSTEDVDFCIENEKDYKMVDECRLRIKNEIRIDLFKEGYIFSVQLPEDYIKLATKSNIKFTNMNLRQLNPLDIIISKTDRLNQRDIEDIKMLVKKKRVDKKRLTKRYKLVTKFLPGHEENFKYNMKYVLNNLF